jgi:GNAT superfamily N-acetyltransferase
VTDASVVFRPATMADLPAIIALLADDPLGGTREDASLPLDGSYERAFHAIQSSGVQQLLVAERDQAVIGTMTLLILPTISHRGATRGQIEAVRVARACRGDGIGAAFVEWAVEHCRAAGCASVQLLSDQSRSDAHRFWARCGFAPSHVGFKRKLM